jgi:RNA polymerase sigma-70 factor, ECF subfamily
VRRFGKSNRRASNRAASPFMSGRSRYHRVNVNIPVFLSQPQNTTYTSNDLSDQCAQPELASKLSRCVLALSPSLEDSASNGNKGWGWVQTVSPIQNHEALGDNVLLQQWCAGDEEAATALVQRYCRRLHGLIASQCSAALTSKMEVEDIAQSVFRLMFQSVKTHGYQVPDHQELWGLLLVLALNKIRNRERELRTSKRDVHRTIQGEIHWDQLADRDDAAATFLNVLLEDELRDLPEAQQQMIRMRLEGYNLNAIAEACHRSTRTVERVLQSFRSKLEDLPWTSS